ncbi:MAG TPA: insulinase family protein, partial [Flavipsychrobacter sp.]|nr:insulinase family protein [Flavipsychrobacter sp.]
KNGGMTQEELLFTKSSIGQSDARNYESGFQKAGFLSRILDYNLPSDYPKKQNEMLASMTLTDVNATNKKYLPAMDNMNIVLVGDKDKVWDGIQKLGYEIVELDANGEPVIQ